MKYCRHTWKVIRIEEGKRRPKHNNKNQIEKDIQRQSEIEQELNCKFVRIKSS